MVSFARSDAPATDMHTHTYTYIHTNEYTNTTGLCATPKIVIKWLNVDLSFIPSRVYKQVRVGHKYGA